MDTSLRSSNQDGRGHRGGGSRVPRLTQASLAKRNIPGSIVCDANSSLTPSRVQDVPPCLPPYPTFRREAPFRDGLCRTSDLKQSFPVSLALKRFATIVSHRTNTLSGEDILRILYSYPCRCTVEPHGSECARKCPAEQRTSSRRTATKAPPNGASILLHHTKLHLGDDPKTP